MKTRVEFSLFTKSQRTRSSKAGFLFYITLNILTFIYLKVLFKKYQKKYMINNFKFILLTTILLPSIVNAEYIVKIKLESNSVLLKNINTVPNSDYNDYLNSLFALSSRNQDNYNETCGLFPNGIKNDFEWSASGISNTDANCVHLPNQDLSNATFNLSAINWANFIGSNLSGAEIIDSQMEFTNFKNADLSNSTLTTTALLNSNFENTNLSNSEFNNSDLSNSSFLESNLTNAVFGVGTNLTQTVFENANLNGVNFSGNNGLIQTVFKNSDLRNANFGPGTGFLQTEMNGVDLRGAVFSDALDISGVTFTNILYDETTVWPSWFTPPPSR